MSRVVIKGLVKRYDGVAAVEGVDLDIAEGELIVLLGPSGCGKTTTLRAVAGLEDIDEGEIILGSQVVSAPGFSLPPERRKIGMVFQSYAIWPHMSVARERGVRAQAASEVAARRGRCPRSSRALALVGLSGLGKRGSSQLSGGQQQRVALARTIVLRAGIAPVRRTAQQSRRQAAGKDAVRAARLQKRSSASRRSMSPMISRRRWSSPIGSC